MREQRAGAVVLIGGVADADDYDEQMTELAHSLRSAGSLLVLCGRPPLAKGVPAAVIGYDNEEGAYAITSHVLSQGHRRILFLGGEERHTTSLGRINGTVVPSPLRRGVRPRPDRVRRVHPSLGLSTDEEAPPSKRDFTAVFAATDVMAAGVYAAVNEAGLSVPDDISIVGYDDIELAQDLRPRMTSVHVPYEEIGRTAAKVAADEDQQTRRLARPTGHPEDPRGRPRFSCPPGLTSRAPAARSHQDRTAKQSSAHAEVIAQAVRSVPTVRRAPPGTRAAPE